jgi:hypothetical protein
MAQISLFTGVADWTTKVSLVTPAVSARKDRGVLFFVQQQGVPVDTRNQYLAVVARLTTSYGIYETPLEAKYFPGPFGIMLIVAIPNADFDRNVDCQLELLPKEFKPGSRSDDTVAIEVLYDDDLQSGVVVPIG